MLQFRVVKHARLTKDRRRNAGPYNHGLGLCDYGLLLPDILGALPAAVGGNCTTVTAAAATPLQHSLVLGRLAGETTQWPNPMKTLRHSCDHLRPYQ